MLTDLDRIVVAARYRRPVVQPLRRVLGAEVERDYHLPLCSAERTTLRAGVSEIEVLEPVRVGAVAGLLGEPQGERHVGLALLRGLLHPAAEHQYSQLSLFPDSLEELEDLVV